MLIPPPARTLSLPSAIGFPPMVGELKTEQQDDDSKKGYCETEFDKSDDKKKGLFGSYSRELVAYILFSLFVL